MINLQSHNQVLYHLTQFTSAITPRSSSLVVKVKKQNNSECKKTEGILCKDSFQEAVKSFNELGIDKIDIENLATPLRLRKNDVWEILEHLYKKESSDVVRNINSWKVSYVSGASFNENKRGFPFSQLSQTTLPAIQLYIGTQRRFFHKFGSLKIHSDKAQIRFFKTDRSIKAELKRNPTLSTRIQKWIGLNTQRDNYMERLSGNVSTTSAAIREHGDIDKLKKYQNDKYIRADELQRIKAAYSEGYQAGNEQKPQGKAYKAIKFMQQLMSTIVLVVIFIGVIASTGAGVFKIQLGEKVQIDPESVDVTFNDVKGIEESKSELMNVVEFLKNPDKFSALGGKLPKGVLLMGPPGTGKTLLARAVAGEAGVPFYHAAGPEFDEVFVGQGARRVRELFKAAKEHAPCVVFIDEIDSVGAKRTHSSLHPYANQTVNQLLSEMDGFHQNEGIIVLGATNRREDLDNALLRPGRFDSIITVHKPDVTGRKDIINLYLVKILTREIDVTRLAKCTVGFTGADIQNLINQAALLAALGGAEYVTMEHFEQAIDKVTMGPETKSRVSSLEDIRITAYHEAGHALVAHYTAQSSPVHKVSVIARGSVLGFTKRLDRDMIHQSKENLLANMDVCMGGRAGEELIFGPDKVTTGSTRDIATATEIAEAMVWKLGMSEKVGIRVHYEKGLVNGMYSTKTRELIDTEVKRLLTESYDRAMSILKLHSQEHKLIAETLLKYETLNGEDIQLLLNGEKSQFEALKDNVKREIIGIPKNVM